MAKKKEMPVYEHELTDKDWRQYTKGKDMRSSWGYGSPGSVAYNWLSEVFYNMTEKMCKKDLPESFKVVWTLSEEAFSAFKTYNSYGGGSNKLTTLYRSMDCLVRIGLERTSPYSSEKQTKSCSLKQVENVITATYKPIKRKIQRTKFPPFSYSGDFIVNAQVEIVSNGDPSQPGTEVTAEASVRWIDMRSERYTTRKFTIDLKNQRLLMKKENKFMTFINQKELFKDINKKLGAG